MQGLYHTCQLHIIAYINQLQTNMYLTKIILVSWLVTLSLSSCKDDQSVITDPIPNPEIIAIEHSGSFTIRSRETLLKTEEEFVHQSIAMNGEGEILNMGNVEIAMEHQLSSHIGNGQTEITEGRFQIHLENGDWFEGTYSALPVRTSSPSQEFNLMVNQGAGSYQGSYGTLRLNLSAKSDNKHSAKLAGRLFLKVSSLEEKSVE